MKPTLEQRLAAAGVKRAPGQTFDEAAEAAGLFSAESPAPAAEVTPPAPSRRFAIAGVLAGWDRMTVDEQYAALGRPPLAGRLMADAVDEEITLRFGSSLGDGQRQLELLTAERDRVGAQAASLQAEIARLRDEKTELEASANSRRADIERLNREAANARAETGRLVEHAAEIEREIAPLRLEAQNERLLANFAKVRATSAGDNLPRESGRLQQLAAQLDLVADPAERGRIAEEMLRLRRGEAAE